MGQRGQDYVLSGIVELDDAYSGVPKSNGKRGRGTEKTDVPAAVSLTEQGHPHFSKVQVSNFTGFVFQLKWRFCSCAFRHCKLFMPCKALKQFVLLFEPFHQVFP